MQFSVKALPQAWQNLLGAEFDKPYFQKLNQKIQAELDDEAVIYPPLNTVFKAFHLTLPQNIRVVILGQDPYHGEGQAMGLSFSVPDGSKVPPSLKNIYKEIHADTGAAVPVHGNLTRWAEQGVFLLNTALTVRAGQAGSHAKFGWHDFTDAVIAAISETSAHVVFVLWGNHAIGKKKLIDEARHLVLESVHPSPLSAHRGFFGSKPFSNANLWLQQQGIEPVRW